MILAAVPVCICFNISKEIPKTSAYDQAMPQTHGPQLEKNCLQGFANSKGTDQPAQPCSPISAFVIRLLESILSNLATSKITLF